MNLRSSRLPRLFLRVLAFTLLFLVTSITILFFAVSSPPEDYPASINTVNDVTKLNEISVDKIVRPTSADTISMLVSQSAKVSIGGARHSMGGQIGAENSLHLDMRSFNKVLAFSETDRLITVQTGITWRQVQEYIDPYNLSVMIMQTYADFTVGGSLSVNVHGRYIGQGPLIHSVQSIKVVLSNGEIVNASRTENSEIFSACIGGYGGFGVIVEATLRLTENTKVDRQSAVMPAKDYVNYFMTSIRDNQDVIFHNGDLYPDDYSTVRAVSYVKTSKDVTESAGLIPVAEDYRIERFAMWFVSEFPAGKWVRQHWADPLVYDVPKVVYRNYEASYNAMELEPTSRKDYTYVLQEYFVPVANFDSFVPKMASIFQSHNVNVINVSIRHAKSDTLSLLAWAPQEVFCFVVYYKQETTPEAKAAVGVWTRELIDAALSEGGSYYLPYQLHATEEQFHKAYPRAKEVFDLKRKVDPDNKFTNKFWEKYY